MTMCRVAFALAFVGLSTALLASTGAAQQTARDGHTLSVNGFEMYYETVGQGGCAPTPPRLVRDRPLTGDCSP